MSDKKRIAIVGGTSAMAERCARIWAEAGTIDLTLLGRDAGRLAAIADDLRARSPGSIVRILQAEFLDAEGIGRAVDEVAAEGSPDIVLIAHGSLPDQAECQQDLQACRSTLEINAVSPVLYAEAFARHMSVRGAGTLVIIGSVAGDRGRKSNYVYGAAKSLVQNYVQGMQHRFAGSGVRVVLIKPGPTDTPMTAALKEHGMKLAPVDDVARGIVRAIERRDAVAYVPAKWRLIMFVIRHLPARIFNRLNI